MFCNMIAGSWCKLRLASNLSEASVRSAQIGVGFHHCSTHIANNWYRRVHIHTFVRDLRIDKYGLRFVLE